MAGIGALRLLDAVVAAASRATPTPYDIATDECVFLGMGLGGIDLDAVLAALPSDIDGWIVVEVDRPGLLQVRLTTDG